MGYWAKIVFRLGYLPIEHAAVKREFLDWYFQAAHDHRVIEGLDLDNSELTKYALMAATKAENLDEDHEVVELIDTIDEHRERASSLLKYGFVISVLLGLGISGAGITSFEGLALETAAIVVGGTIAGTATLIFCIYHVVTHQIRSNLKVMRMFNEELTEKPGDIRRHDREWEELAAQFFWNKSLCSPKTLVALLLLSIVRAFSERLYGIIAADLHYNIREFIDMNAREIIKFQIQRFKSRDFPTYAQV